MRRNEIDKRETLISSPVEVKVASSKTFVGFLA